MNQNDYIDKVFNCDCLQGMRRMIDDGVKVDAVITDPPYILHSNAKGDSELCKRLRKKKENIEFITDDFDYKQGFDLMLQLCKVPNVITFCSNKQLGRTINFFEEKGLTATTLVWSKLNPAPTGYGCYISDLEYIVYARGKGACWNYDAQRKFYLKTKRYGIVTNSKYHETEKPMGLMQELIEVHSLRGG